MDITKDPFAEYLRAAEPGAKQRGQHWSTAIGLQAVDGLTPSPYLLDTARRNIEGEISLDEAGQLVHSYYESKAARPEQHPDRRTEEADKVSVRIAALLAEPGFSFTPGEYLATHKRLFEGVFPHAGQLREYNITKKEWVLDGATVMYGSADQLWPTLEYDFGREREFSYKGLEMPAIIRHLSRFVADLWQIHCFAEGNTRTTAVFFIRYLRTLGFAADNQIFAENSWYFRNALVRANYTDLRRGIHEDTAPLERFLENLLMGTDHPLQNRTLHLRWQEEPNIAPEIVPNIQNKTEHSPQKPNIGDRLTGLSPKVMGHALALRQALGQAEAFGRSDAMAATGLGATQASALLKELQSRGILQPVTGRGKGKVKFAL